MSKKGIFYEFPLRKNCSEVKTTGTEQGRATTPEQDEAQHTRSSAAAAAAPLAGLLPNLTFFGIESPHLCEVGRTSRLPGRKAEEEGVTRLASQRGHQDSFSKCQAFPCLTTSLSRNWLSLTTKHCSSQPLWKTRHLTDENKT